MPRLPDRSWRDPAPSTALASAAGPRVQAPGWCHPPRGLLGLGAAPELGYYS